MPRPRPPFPLQPGSGQANQHQQVETFANVAPSSRGSRWYASLGTEKSKGTKIFALREDQQHGPCRGAMGITWNAIIFAWVGESRVARSSRQPDRGPSGGCIPASLLNLPSTTIVDGGRCHHGLGRLDHYGREHLHGRPGQVLPHVHAGESCGKCVPCRMGTKRMLEILQRITEGKGCWRISTS